MRNFVITAHHAVTAFAPRDKSNFHALYAPAKRFQNQLEAFFGRRVLPWIRGVLRRFPPPTKSELSVQPIRQAASVADNVSRTTW